MAGGGGTDLNTQFVQSPQQRAIWNAMKPAFRRYKGFFRTEEPLWSLPALPEFPSYEIPDIKSMMPQGDWWGSLDANVRQGIMAPFLEGQKQLFEQFGSKGMAGSARGGASGAFGRAGAEYWAKEAAPQMAMAGWNMISPALQAGWKGELAKRADTAQAGWQALMQQYGNQLQQRTWPWQSLSGLAGLGLSYPIVQQQQPNPWMGMLGGAAGSFLGSVGSKAGDWLAGKIF
jgi:hypothetical protein